jgi:hypothetical protein
MKENLKMDKWMGQLEVFGNKAKKIRKELWPNILGNIKMVKNMDLGNIGLQMAELYIKENGAKVSLQIKEY